MGAGDYPAGEGPAGTDPPPDPSAYVAPFAPTAALFSLEKRQHELDDDGHLFAAHPIDAMVTIALGFVRKGIPSAPNVGLDVDLLSSASPASALSTATDACRRALKTLIDAGDIRLVSVTLFGTPERGRNEFVATYENRRLPRPEPRGVRF